MGYFYLNKFVYVHTRASYKVVKVYYKLEDYRAGILHHFVQLVIEKLLKMSHQVCFLAFYQSVVYS